MEYVIETTAVSKIYGKKSAVNKVSMHVRRGDIYGLIGRNGAGKTTLMKLILGLVRANEGSIRLFGSNNLDEGRKKVGSLVEIPGLYKDATAYENLYRFSLLFGTPQEEIQPLLEFVGLGDTGKKKVGAFSLGMKQRLGIAVALLGNPEILILDEPTNGLDPAGIKEIRDIIIELKNKGVTFVVSSHLLDELGKVATTYGIMNNGVLVEEISAEELRAKCRKSIKIVVDDVEKAKAVLTERHPEIHLETAEGSLKIFSDVDDLSEENKALVQADVRVYEIVTTNESFEEFFIEKVGQEQ